MLETTTIVEPATFKKPITAADIIEMLKKKYSANRDEWVFFSEMRCGTGYKKDAERRIDFWALNCWKGHQRIAYEIKVSRQDFLKELKDPKKRRMALLFSNEFYFIAPKGLIKVEELPPECGLIEVSWANNQSEIDKLESDHKTFPKEECYASCKRGDLCWRHQPIPEFVQHDYLAGQTVVVPPYLDSMPPSWNFMASIARRLMKEAENDRSQT